METPLSIPDAISQAGFIDEIDDNEHIEEIEKAMISQPPGTLSDGNIVGKLFPTMDDAYNWYNQYALGNGFGIRIDYNRRSKTSKEIIMKRFVCNKEGFKIVKDDDGVPIMKRQRESRTGCKALMKIKIAASKEWIIAKFDDIHNHPLTTPSKVRKHRSHSTFHRTDACKSLVGELSSAGVRPCMISRALTALTGSQEDVVTPKQCSEIIQIERRRNIGKECYGIIKHFQDKSAVDDSHFFAMDVDEEGILRSVFWSDGRSRAAYTQFGDVVVFDVTYKTNKFKMPFAPFVGVNHHRQSILFGGALLVDEKESTFTWLFDQFFKCMHNIAPYAIITDQDKAMANAIKNVFPDTRHRFCAWHIKKHVMEHLSSYRAQYNDFNSKYNDWVKSDTVDEFESGWELIRITFNVEEGSWLDKMYKLRKHWVKAYLKDQFFAGMSTSGRSESINAFFDGYVNAQTMLNDFVTQYDLAVKARREVENNEDFKTLNTKAVLISKNHIEEQAGKFYTRAIFNIFQKEWLKVLDLIDEKVFEEGNVVTYRVGVEEAEVTRWRTVTYEVCGTGFKSSCSCAKFEMDGLLCKHILYVVKKNCGRYIPNEYLLDRWSIDARYRVQGIGSMSVYDETSQLRMWSIRARVSKLLEDSRNNPFLIKKFGDLLDGLLLEAAEFNRSNQIDAVNFCSQVQSSRGDYVPQTNVHDPPGPVKTKGRPKTATRMKSGIELSQEKKKQNSCSFCGEKGHNIKSCQKRKEDGGEGQATCEEMGE